MTTPTPPLFVSEYPNDLTCFSSEAELLGKIEPWFPDWVPEYQAYDSRGLRLELSTDAPLVGRRLLFGLLRSDNAHELTLRLDPAEPEPTHQHELRRLLICHLAYADAAPSVEADVTLAELVDTVVARQAAFRTRPSLVRRILLLLGRLARCGGRDESRGDRAGRTS